MLFYYLLSILAKFRTRKTRAQEIMDISYTQCCKKDEMKLK
jgi:hypothetical protein